jgi:hypothetical protein
VIITDNTRTTSGPTDAWVAAYKAAHVPADGKMSIAPAPELAWACEQILGGHSPDVVLPAMQEAGELWNAVRTLHAKVVRARERLRQ